MPNATILFNVFLKPSPPRSGFLYGAGNNSQGQLGLNDKINRSTFTQITNTKYIDVSFNNDGLSAIDENGDLWQIGSNYRGSGSAFYNSVPILISSDVKFKSVHCSAHTTYLISENNDIYGIGRGNFGTGDVSLDLSSPTKIHNGSGITAFTAGSSDVGYKTLDGNCYVWGNNAYGVLNLNNDTVVSTPTLVPGGPYRDFVFDSRFNNFSYNSAAVKYDGTLWAAGYNNNGQLGQNNTTTRSSLIQIGSSSDWNRVFFYENILFAIKEDGTLWFTGLGQYSIIGNGVNNNIRSTITQIGTDSNWISVTSAQRTAIYHNNDEQCYLAGLGVSGNRGEYVPVSNGSVLMDKQNGVIFKTTGYHQNNFLLVDR